MAQASYICFRFFLVALEEHLFTRPATSRDKLRWFAEAFLANRDLTGPTGVEYAVRITERQGNLFFGKLSRRQPKDIRKKGPKDIVETTIDDWPFVNFVCDVASDHQLLVIRYNTAIFRSPAELEKVLTHLANNWLFVHGYAASFKPIVDEASFWRIVSESEGVFTLRFELQSPNLFGASIRANEALKEVQRRYNNNRTRISLSNDKGELRLPEDEVDSYREYADKGGGSWELVVKRNGRKRRHKSSDRAVRISIDVGESSPLNAEVLKSALIKFLERL